MPDERNKGAAAKQPEATKSKLPTLPKRSSPFSKLADLDPLSFASPPSLAEQAKVDPQTAASESAPDGEKVDVSEDLASPAPIRAEAVPAVRAAARATRPGKPAMTETPGEVMVLQTSVPFEIALAFKALCARSRSSVREELAKLVQAAVDRAR
ncbi:hypothetical protein [Rhizobium sp. NXC24]|uniref:hypothetical protein n=1 Tax=Rhizobium sp. NXC24 TaxID=2048897 RepID=UPI000CDF44EA|nr:hypothetical protein [Rhizobium sp. NXC24]AVA23819.1 hypothetical protein NXC24_PA00173 [Rhizobium sp. NXC24]